MDNDLSKHNFSDDIEHIKHALEDRGLELCGYFWGKPTSKTRNQTRFGRKGSKAFSTAGKYRGLCSDFELEEHGNLLQLIKREMSFSSWAEVFQWAKEWLGMPEHHSTRSIFKTKPRPVETSDDFDEQKSAKVAKLISETTPVAGTLAETYLRKRGIALESFPDSVRYHSGSNSLAVIITDSNGAEIALQRVRLTGEGTKAAVKVPKVSNGPIGQGYVRFPAGGAQ